MGYPAYLVPVLIVVKLLGVAAILSRFRVALSDLAYAGMFFHLLLAFSAHLNAIDFGGAVPSVAGAFGRGRFVPHPERGPGDTVALWPDR